MLESFTDTMRERSLEDIELAQADVLALKSLPLSWNNYDLIVSAAMLEYVPRGELPTALGELRELLVQGGSLLVFISRRNWLTRPLIARWWRANVYSASEIRLALQDAGFSSINFCQFPARFRYLALWGYIVEARRET